MMKYAKICLSVLFAASLAGCREMPHIFSGDTVLAKANGHTLLLMDVESIFTPGLSADDSVKLLESYVDMWVKRELKLEEAERLFEESEQDIEAMVREYRNSLLTRRLEQYYVDSAIDTVFTESDIEGYYAEHRNDFRLDRNIVQGKIVRLPKSYRQKSKLRELMKQTSPEKAKDLEDWCTKNDLEMASFTTWVDYDEVLSLMTVRGAASYESYLTESGLQEMSDRENDYFFIISQTMRRGTPAPLPRVRESIRRLLFNQRKAEIVRAREDSLYRVALVKDKITINID